MKRPKGDKSLEPFRLNKLKGWVKLMHKTKAPTLDIAEGEKQNKTKQI